jgi:hypothetical protein
VIRDEEADELVKPSEVDLRWARDRLKRLQAEKR